jgi:hypothetical protein
LDHEVQAFGMSNLALHEGVGLLPEFHFTANAPDVSPADFEAKLLR